MSRGFNPLAGIRSFLTSLIEAGVEVKAKAFQSPRGDSFFSDKFDDGEIDQNPVKFQSPRGDSFFSDA